MGLTTLPPSYADCLELWEPQPPGTLRACPGLSWVCFTFTVIVMYMKGKGTRGGTVGRHCATSRKVVGSIPDGVIGIFHGHNPSCRTMVLGFTQPLTEMSTRNISWRVKAVSE